MSKIKSDKQILSGNMKKVTLAIVFLDIINSTKFVQKNGALKSAAWFQVHDKIARNLIYRHNGREIDRSDGFMLSFYNLGDAVQFALKYQEVIPKKTPFNSRIGIHWTDIIEVHQEDKYTAVGAKSVELEGIGKATAARCMSICQEKQILLTKQAFLKLKSIISISKYVNKDTRTAMVGLYKFKGVSNPQVVYAVGNTIKSLQPPPSSEKVKRIGGSKKIKSRLKHKKMSELFWYFFWKLFWIELIFIIYIAFDISSNIHHNQLFEYFSGIDLNYYLEPLINIVNKFYEFIAWLIEGYKKNE